MNRILCSTGSLITRRNGRNYRLLADLAPRLSCDGFEFMMYDSWYENSRDIIKEIKSYGLNFPVLHCEKTIGEHITAEDGLAYELFEKNCFIASELGAKLIVLHLWNGISSDSNFDANLKAFQNLREMAESYDLLLTAENVVCNVKTPSQRINELTEAYPDISVTFDTKMAQFHGELSLAYNKRLWTDNIRHLHINDYSGGIKDWSNLKTEHIGDGNVDFDSFFAYVREMGYTGDFTVEATSVQPDGTVDIDKLNADFLKIKGYIA